MVIFLLFMIVINVCLVSYVVWSRIKLREISKKVKILCNEDTNMLVTSELQNKDIQELIDEINQLHTQCKKLVRESKRRDQQIKETITGLSHDIRTPLTSLDGYFQLLIMCEDAEEKAHYISIIRNRIGSLKEILEELFTYAKLQDANYHLDLYSVNITSLCFKSVVSYYDDFKKAKIEPKIKLIEENVYVNGNTTAIKRVFQNIIKNGLVHTKSEVTIKFWKKENNVYFSCTNDVEDPKNIDMTRIFERFYTNENRRNSGSTGLGLAIAKGLTNAMNGTIEASLNVDQFQIKVSFPVEMMSERDYTL